MIQLRFARALPALCLALLLTACGGGGGGTPLSPDEAAYQAALSSYSLGKYSTAASGFATFIADFTGPGSTRLDDARYYRGRSLHRQASLDFKAATTPAQVSAAQAAFTTARGEYDRVISQFSGGILVDNATYQKAKTYYDAANFVTARANLSAFIATYQQTTSQWLDNAHYFLARITHEQAKADLAIAATPAQVTTALAVFATARGEYTQFALDFPVSTLKDDARFYAAKTWYDGADYPMAQTKLAAFLPTVQGTLSSRRDDAYYYLGRAIHRQGAAQWKIAVTPQQQTDALARLSQARTQYAQVTVANPLSTLGDNAAYQIGLTRFDGADYPTAKTAMITFIGSHQTPPSSLLDNARYYLGRSIQGLASDQLAVAQTQLEIDAALAGFAAARAEYAKLPIDHPTSTSLDDAAFYTARGYYDAGDYVTAQTQLASFITAHTPLAGAVPSTRLDDAHYYLGRANHQQGTVQLAAAPATPAPAQASFAAARNEYALITAISYPNSSLVDDAAFRIAMTYYNGADYPMAETHLGAFITTYTPLLSTRLDDAHYYKGRAIHRQAATLLAAAINPADTLAAQVRFGDARNEYTLVTAISYPNSSLVDDAAYQAAITYFDGAAYPTAIADLTTFLATYTPINVNRVTSRRLDDASFHLARSNHSNLQFAVAETGYRGLLTNFPTSIYIDNAQYFLALSFHDRGICATEKLEMQQVVTLYPTSFFAPLAQAHLDDIGLITPLLGHPTVCI